MDPNYIVIFLMFYAHVCIPGLTGVVDGNKGAVALRFQLYLSTYVYHRSVWYFGEGGVLL